MHENNAWIKPRKDGHDCITTHVEDFIVVAKDSDSHINKIKETINLRSKGEMSYFLGYDIRRKKNVLWATLAKTSIYEVISKA